MKAPVRKNTKAVPVGRAVIGGKNPVLVQSMTSTLTANVRETVRQINRLVRAGCEMVRVAVPDRRAAKALGLIKAKMTVPLAADIHFNVSLALKAIEAGVDKVRINPGNIGGRARFEEVIRRAKARGTAMRIGVNSGSVEKALLDKHGGPTPQALVESALNYLEICRAHRFDRVVVSIKSSNCLDALKANRMLSAACDYPVHLGITEAGNRSYGAIKSAVGMGALLLEGIGDTLRVSLTGDPVSEIPVAYDILKAAGARIVTPEIISCPTCGRLQYNMEKVAAQIQKRLRGVKKPVRVAVMGCVVNGPGEAREADIALAGGRKTAILFKKGVEVKRVRERDMVDEVVKAVRDF
jgi:(E)-4-hydroxy-3-methylbut-2-enyl-diphosphate synthase